MLRYDIRGNLQKKKKKYRVVDSVNLINLAELFLRAKGEYNTFLEILWAEWNYQFSGRRDRERKRNEEAEEKRAGQRATGKLIAARSIWQWCFAAEQSHESPLDSREREREGANGRENAGRERGRAATRERDIGRTAFPKSIWRRWRERLDIRGAVPRSVGPGFA